MFLRLLLARNAGFEVSDVKPGLDHVVFREMELRRQRLSEFGFRLSHHTVSENHGPHHPEDEDLLSVLKAVVERCGEIAERPAGAAKRVGYFDNFGGFIRRQGELLRDSRCHGVNLFDNEQAVTRCRVEQECRSANLEIAASPETAPLPFKGGVGFEEQVKNVFHAYQIPTTRVAVSRQNFLKEYTVWVLDIIPKRCPKDIPRPFVERDRLMLPIAGL